MKGKRQTQCEARFPQLCALFGRKQRQDKKEVGSWRLANDFYGGWRICEICEDGSEKIVFGLTCDSSAQMATGLHWALRAAELKNKGGEQQVRTTNKELAVLFGQLCRALGRNETDDTRQPGSWHLEHNSVYGWRIVQDSKGGGESCPLGYRSYSAGEMATVIRFALRALEIKRGGQND
jgi:hypothetical protein